MSDLSSTAPLDSFSTWRWIDMPHHSDERGSIVYLQHRNPLPFEVRRIYYLLGVSPDATRGHHAHRSQHQIIIPLSGAFSVHLENLQQDHACLRLDQPHRGLYFGPWHWHHLSDFTPGAVCLILASQEFREEDYVREYQTYRTLQRQIPLSST